jgi:hypothetical protein
MPQNRPWQVDLLQESLRNPVLLDGCMQPHLMVRLGRSSLKHTRPFHGPCFKASRIFFGASMPKVVDLAGEAAAWLKDLGYALILLMLGTKSSRFSAKITLTILNAVL